MEGEELVGVDADEAVAAAQVVVEEGEGFVGVEGEEPEGEFGEFDGARIFVDAVEAALGDESPRDDRAVRVRGRRLRQSSLRCGTRRRDPPPPCERVAGLLLDTEDHADFAVDWLDLVWVGNDKEAFEGEVVALFEDVADGLSALAPEGL